MEMTWQDPSSHTRSTSQACGSGPGLGIASLVSQGERGRGRKLCGKALNALSLSGRGNK